MAASMLHALLGGDKPKVPDYPMVDFGEEQTGAIKQNIRALPGLEKLASRVNAFSADELTKGLEKMFPGYAGILSKGTEILQSQMRGEIPEDVQRNISRVAAERSRAGGYAGSDFAGALEARDLGLTSLDIIDRSLNTAERWMQEAAQRTPQFNFSSMFVTPQQRIATRVGENANRFQRDWMAAQIKALPEPWEQALINLADNIEEIGQSALSAYAGGAMGGMGGMGGSGSSAPAASPTYSFTPAAFDYSSSSPAPATYYNPGGSFSIPGYSPSAGYVPSGSVNPYFPRGGGP